MYHDAYICIMIFFLVLYFTKTNVTMVSKDRELFGVIIKQDTKTSFMSLTDLQEAYTRKRIEMGWNEKRIENILSNKESAERIYYILEKQGYTIEAGFPGFIQSVEKESLIKVMKKMGAYKTMGRGENRRTMCNPYIWVLVAMELNPMLYAEVVTWLTDKLILNRIEAGDKYNVLSRAISRFPDADYTRMAKGLNWIVFNEHESMIRNRATQEQLKELEMLQSNLAFCIEMGTISSFSDLINMMGTIYKKKWGSGAVSSKNIKSSNNGNK